MTVVSHSGPRERRGAPESELALVVGQLVAATGLSLESLAAKVGATTQSMSAYQRGERVPPSQIMRGLLVHAGASPRQVAEVRWLARAYAAQRAPARMPAVERVRARVVVAVVTGAALVGALLGAAVGGGIGG